MKVMFTINADKKNLKEAQELRDKFENLVKEYGLESTIKGDIPQMGNNFSGSYSKPKSKSKPKFVPKYDPSQYFKPKQ